MSLSTIVYSGVPGSQRRTFLAGDNDTIKTVHEVYDNTYALGLPELANAVVVDVGANVGAFTVLALDHHAAGVVAIEPDLHTAAYCEANLANALVTKHVRLLVAAAGDPAVPRALHLGQGVHRTTRPTFAGDEEALPTYGLDQLVAMARDLYGPEGRLVLKVDCEGAEYELIGAAELATLFGVDLIRLEWHGNIAAGQPPALGRIGPLVERLLLARFSVTLFGHPDSGGMLHAHR